MSVESAGVATADRVVLASRTSITTDDTTYPSGTGQAGAVAVPPFARSALVHALVRAVGSGNTVACRITIFGYSEVAGARWYVLGQLNSGAAITRTTKTAVADGNNIGYAETLSHVSAYSLLYAQIDATVALDTGVSVWFAFEES